MNHEILADPLLPAEMAIKAENIGIKKANMKFSNMFVLSMLAGVFIAIGAIFTATVTSGSITATGNFLLQNATETTGTVIPAITFALPFGITKLVGGLAFSLGLILVVVGGAELFTGNNLILMAFASRKVTLKLMLRNWLIVYIGNFIGSIGTAYIMFFTKQYTFGKGAIGLNALSIADGKCNLDFVQAIALGIMCNILVCMAVWMCYSAKNSTDKIMAIIAPIACFISGGFEHCVANMYIIPIGLFIKKCGGDAFFQTIGKTAADFSHLTWSNFAFANLIPVTIGNIIGGGIMVGLVHWFVYLRKRNHH